MARWPMTSESMKEKRSMAALFMLVMRKASLMTIAGVSMRSKNTSLAIAFTL